MAPGIDGPKETSSTSTGSVGDAILKAPDVEVLSLDAALSKMEEAGYEREARVVHLRFFAGLSIDEAAPALGVSNASVRRDWTLAKSWLHRSVRTSAPGVMATYWKTPTATFAP